MGKQIFILNGIAGVGKDTFAEMLGKFIPTLHISSITPIKAAAKSLGWDGTKTNASRYFLSELKKFVNEYSNFIWDYLDKEVNKFRNYYGSDDQAAVMLIDIREPEEIEKAVIRYNCKTILVERDVCTKDYCNSADESVYDYKKYDYVINNMGSLDELLDKAKEFAEIIKAKKSHKVVAVDFDGTIANTDYPRIISPISETISLLRKLKDKGATIILWTCREGENLEEAVKWCKENDVPIDLVNENDKERIKIWGNDCRKIGADLYIDDKTFSLWHDRRDEKDIIDFIFNDVKE